MCATQLNLEVTKLAGLEAAQLTVLKTAKICKESKAHGAAGSAAAFSLCQNCGDRKSTDVIRTTLTPEDCRHLNPNVVEVVAAKQHAAHSAP
jgi:hypothetical protein